MNKKQQVVALTLAITLLLSGCSGLTIGSSEKQEQDTQQSLNVGQSTASGRKNLKRRQKNLSATKKFRPRWKVRVCLLHIIRIGTGKACHPSI